MFRAIVRTRLRHDYFIEAGKRVKIFVNGHNETELRLSILGQ